ncbi:hypothetical protein [Bacillus pumilus]|uniref:hypothetical protein n=2 Tax=Bacillus pumilus TaxID=1408 RepID=UPI001B3A1F0E|nr:hypothetical protein [Bacillus pumilus]MBQ4817272.1 hypothetical protein [Bacillus pumilus]
MKLRLVISFVFLCVSIFFSIDASAATSKWQTPYFAKSSCKVRVWTDATNYSKTAKTVDFTIEQNGKCGELRYQAHLSPIALYTYNAKFVRGSFKYKTPLKKLSLNLPEYKQRGYEAKVFVDLYSKNGKDLGFVESNKLNIKKR